MSTIVLLFIAVLNITKIRFDKKTLIISGILMVWMITISLLSDVPESIWILRIIRNTMMIFMIIVCSWLFGTQVYIRLFVKSIIVVTFIGCFYGIYQAIAVYYDLPYFLNIFSTNTSYHPRDLYEYYGGWIDIYRIYGVFDEPSFYAAFLILVSVILLHLKLNSLIKVALWILIIINIISTFSRLGYACFAIVVMSYYINSLNFIFMNKKLQYYIIGFLLISIPLIMPGISYLLYHYDIFSDLSISGRTNSQLYYFEEARLFGFGMGSIKAFSSNFAVIGDIEKFAHNALASIAYEWGIVAISFYYYIMLSFLKNSKIPGISLCVVAAVSSLLSFGEFYNIESILIMFCLLTKYAKFMEENSNVIR
ncbi:hypothetical protein [Pelosinus fermentans]|nr:hypothetical protein [Pelosinus fermentans]